MVGGYTGDPHPGNLLESTDGRTTLVRENQREALPASGLTFSDVVQTRIYLTNMSDFTTVNRVYSSCFHDSFTVYSAVQVAGLPKGALVEIEMVAENR